MVFSNFYIILHFIELCYFGHLVTILTSVKPISCLVNKLSLKPLPYNGWLQAKGELPDSKGL